MDPKVDGIQIPPSVAPLRPQGTPVTIPPTIGPGFRDVLRDTVQPLGLHLVMSNMAVEIRK